MFIETEAILFPFYDHQNGLVAVREWLMAGGDPLGRESNSGTPWWAIAMERGWVEAVDELLAAGADPNQRSADGEGWLHWCIRTQMPAWLVAQGFRKLGRGWWYPNEQGENPFLLENINPGVFQMMQTRWWSERHQTSPGTPH